MFVELRPERELNGARAGAPKYMEWYAAFGLMVTLVWRFGGLAVVGEATIAARLVICGRKQRCHCFLLDTTNLLC